MGLCELTAARFSVGTMRKAAEAHLSFVSLLPWRCPRWLRKRPEDDVRSGCGAGCADPAHRGRTVRDCVSEGGPGTKGLHRGERVLRSRGLEAARRQTVQRGDF